MFYDNDYSSLSNGAVNIPMAEGYDCSYGAALALVDSARNDLIMFESMMKVEAAEHAILRESTGYVQEGELQALAEASVSGVWAKIKELFSRLIAKIKAIFHTFISKLDGIFKSDKQLVKKYRTEVNRKSNLGNMKVKWRKSKANNIISFDFSGTRVSDKFEIGDLQKFVDLYDKETDARYRKVSKSETGIEADDSSDLREKFMEAMYEDDKPEEYEFKELNISMQQIMSGLEDSAKALKEVNKYVSKNTSNLAKFVKEADKFAANRAKHQRTDDNDAKSATPDSDGNTYSAIGVEVANKAFASTQTFENVKLVEISCRQEAFKIMYKQAKAAFMKAVAANDKKLEEQAEYLDALAEAAEDEVEDVISAAINSNASYNDILASSNAPADVKAPGTSDDPDHLIGKGYDDPDYHKDKVDGTIDTNYNGKESFFDVEFA